VAAKAPLENSAADRPCANAVELGDAVAALYPELFRLYTDLHANPELSGLEVRTARRIADELRFAGCAVTEGVGGHGVVAVVRNGAGPTVLVRADLDGLPITEETGLPYASTVRGTLAGKGEVGLMHACGHDVHMTVLVGTARLLMAMRERWRGTLVLVGQPKEEVGAGARAMLADGLFTKFPRPDAAVALHVNPAMVAGTVGLREGLFWAGCASLEIRIRGVGGHGSRPHETKDPVVMAAEIILLLQTIVSREIDPAETAVLTVGSIHGGTKGNIIPEEVVLLVNYRYFTAKTELLLRTAIERTVRGVAIAAGVPESRLPTVTLQYTGPPITNDPRLAERILAAFRTVLGEERALRTARLTFSDDFAQFGLDEPKISLCYFLLGTAPKVPVDSVSCPTPGIHNPGFAPVPEPTITTGVTAMVTAVLTALCG
jgi:amidohydrolase